MGEAKEECQCVLDLHDHTLTFAAKGKVDEEFEPQELDESLQTRLLRTLRRKRGKLVQEVALKNITI